VSAVVEDVGDGCDGLGVGDRVAVWPVVACGRCYACSIGRENVCSHIRILGVHFDGALQERLRVPASHIFRVGAQSATAAALVEPVSIAVRAVTRARVAAGEQVAVVGAGPIGQAVCVAAKDRGASVLLVDRVATRLEIGRALGADVAEAGDRAGFLRAIHGWAGNEGPPVVVDATGAPEAVAGAVDAVAAAGRVVVVGISARDVSLAVGSFVFKELDVLGVSCCSAAEFAEAVELVGRSGERLAQLVTHEFPFERAPDALVYAMEHPAEVMKAVIRLDGEG
jgi:L-gulonate 5-dehydrogenase